MKSHNRTWTQIHAKPHIYKWSEDYWAVDYLRGRQSRIRTNLFASLKEARITAKKVWLHNTAVGAQR